MDEPQNSKLSERSKSQKTTYFIISLIRTESRFIVAWDLGWEWGLTVNEHLIEVMKMFQMS